MRPRSLILAVAAFSMLVPVAPAEVRAQNSSIYSRDPATRTDIDGPPAAPALPLDAQGR